ncbi:MAG: alpha-glucan family phosphorylase [Dehalococcoidales bacterium]|nr:alpha-glucan family phosphorylase [Dehalococcoidales bacterium]
MLNNPVLPERIKRLNELANNLWWSWHSEGQELFRSLDYTLWRASGHNPVQQLREINHDQLLAAAHDSAFLRLYDAVMTAFDRDINSDDTWFQTHNKLPASESIAYFSPEFAIHSSLPIYAGGLGILAGDICKEASDLGIPLVGIGFMYPQGYFHQHISAEGWQEEIYRQLNFNEVPISPIRPTPEGGCGPLVSIELGDRPLHLGAWLVHSGRVRLYLLCCNVEENTYEDRQLCSRLYTADREQRIQQEIALGIGGVRVLRQLGIEPSVWHANEGHTSFMMLERIREQVVKGVSFNDAVQRVQATTIFTTNTPVPAGHDIFPAALVERYFNHYWESLGIDRQTFMKLGQEENGNDQTFNMTVLGMKMADYRNGVSQLHGAVARKMWHGLWPELKEDEVPISHVTNGVHLPTWIAPELNTLFEKYLGRDWLSHHDSPELWQHIMDIPDGELWEVHQLLKRKLTHVVRERAQQRLAEDGVAPQQVLAMGALLDSDILTIGFVRRFTEYKRPTLLFHDVGRLKRIIENRWQPVQIIFSGKSHPADFPSKYLLQRVYSLATGPEFQGRIGFVEDYDMHIAHYLVQGVDIWLNTPRRLQEACGTSGMKASLNGVLHLSVRDGWWHEGYAGNNGWAIGDDAISDRAEQDKDDAEALYRILEEEIIPLYYERDLKGIPHGWIRVLKQAISSLAPVFCARRMMKEYTKRMYLPASRSRDSQS